MSDTLIVILFFLACAAPVLLGAAFLKGIERLGRKYPPGKTNPTPRLDKLDNLVRRVLLVMLQVALAFGLLLAIVKTIKWLWYL